MHVDDDERKDATGQGMFATDNKVTLSRWIAGDVTVIYVGEVIIARRLVSLLSEHSCPHARQLDTPYCDSNVIVMCFQMWVYHRFGIRVVCIPLKNAMLFYKSNLRFLRFAPEISRHWTPQYRMKWPFANERLHLSGWFWSWMSFSSIFLQGLTVNALSWVNTQSTYYRPLGRALDAVSPGARYNALGFGELWIIMYLPSRCRIYIARYPQSLSTIT